MKITKKTLALLLSATLLLSVLYVSSLVPVLAKDQYEYEELLTSNFETDAEVKAESGFYCRTSNAAAHEVDDDGYKYEDDTDISGKTSNGRHITIPVVKDGVGNNSSKGVIKLGYDGNPGSNYSNYRPVFSFRCSKAYNGRSVGQSFKTEVGKTYKISFYYKAQTVKTSVSLWMRNYNGSLTNAAVDSNSDSVKLIDVSEATNGYVYVEGLITATKNECLVILMKATDNSKVKGTEVYIDDITVYLQGDKIAGTGNDTVEECLLATFENSDGKDAAYYEGTNKFSNGVAPISGSNNIPNDPRLTCLVNTPGIGNNGSGGAIRFGYQNNPDDTNKAGLPVFSVRCSKSYNGRNDSQSFTFIAGETYTLTFWYKAENINSPVGLYMREYDKSLSGARLDINDASRTVIELDNITSSTNGYVKVNKVFTAIAGQNMVFLMKPTDFSNLAGTTVYVDDISVSEGDHSEPEPEKVYRYDELLTSSFETDAEVKANSGFYCGTSNAAAYKLDTAGYKYKNYDAISGAANGKHMTIPVIEEGIGNNDSKGVIKLGYDGNPGSYSQYRPVFSLRSSMAYNGRSVGQSFQTVAEETYKVSFYYKAQTVNTPVSLWMRTYSGSLTNAAVDSNSDSVKLADISETTDGYVLAEGIITAKKKENLVIFMKAGNYSNVSGTSVYIDDVTVYLRSELTPEELDDECLFATFENSDGKDAAYYEGTNKFSNGVAPISGSNNIPNDPRLTCLVNEAGIGHNGSNGAIRFGYQNNPDSNNKAGLPVFSVRGSEKYNYRNDSQSFRFEAGETYILSFWYKAENINNPIELYMREYDKSLSGARLDTNDISRTVIKLTEITSSTDGYVKVETTFTAIAGQDMVFLMKPTVFSDLAGTTVYIDDISLKLPTDLPKVNFNTNGGNQIKPRTVRPGYEFFTLPVPVRDGYVFEGWFNSDYTVAYTEDTVCPDNIGGSTFYAKWSKISSEAKSFSTSFEETEYSVTPYYNDGNSQYMHNNITKSASWFKNAEISYSGGGAMKITNDPYYVWDGKLTHGFALMNGDGTRFSVIQGQRYKIKYYYYATEPSTAHSHISAIVSSDPLAKYAISSQQVICKKTVHGISDDWEEVEATFEANVTGFVYITLTARISTSEASSRYHTVFVDNVSLDLLDSDFVKVNYYDGTALKYSSVGKKGDTLVNPVLEVKTGYEFTGWYKDAQCTERVTGSVYPSKDANYYAGYETADYSGATASNTTGLTMSFEEELLDNFYGTKQRITNDIDDMGSEIEFIKNDPKNARTGSNYIKMSEIEYHYSEIGFFLYDPNNKYGNLYLEPGESYSISYWILPNDSFNVIQFQIALADISNKKFAVKDAKKIDIKYIDPNDYEEGEWVKVTHTVTNDSNYLRSVALVAPKEGNNCFIDDITVNKMVDVKINFESNGGSTVEPMTIKTYSYIDVVFEPIRDGYEFIGWFADKELTKLFDFENTEITGPMTLYAKWKVDDLSLEDSDKNTDDTNDFDDFLIDDLQDDFDDELDEIDNGEKPIIDDADPVKRASGSTEENKSSNLVVILLIIGGSLLLAAGLFVLILLLLRKKHKKTVVGG